MNTTNTTNQIIKYIVVSEDFKPVGDAILDVQVKLYKKNLILLKELHGSIGVQEFMIDLANRIKDELEMDL